MSNKLWDLVRLTKKTAHEAGALSKIHTIKEIVDENGVQVLQAAN